jgi:xylitol oxidase
MTELKNWAGNYFYQAPQFHKPTTAEQIQELISKSSKVKALGTRHSFNEIADTVGDLISTEHLNQILGLDPDSLTVSMQGGVRYGELCKFLQERGFALHNLASLPHISVAGACATGTHGSGIGIGNLSTAVRALTMVQADGELVRLSRDADPERFAGAAVNLGAFGLITEITLDVEPTYEMEQQVFEGLSFSSVRSDFEAIEASGYSVSLFTDWRSDRFNQVWVKRRIEPGGNPPLPNPFFGARAAGRKMHPIGELPAVNCTEQLGVSGPWFERLPHFRLDFTPSSGTELQTEFFVSRSNAVEALGAVASLADRIAPLLQICEVRTIGADELWLSPAYRRDSLSIHFTWKQEWPAVEELLPTIESALAGLDARPHWAKLFTMGYERLSELYVKLPDFQRLAAEFDPTGKFRNRYLDSKLFAKNS